MATRVQRDHEWLDGRSRALHRAVGERIRRDPSLLRVALDNLDRWLRSSGPDPALEEWRRILEREELGRIVALIAEDSEEANRLRQSSPFAGILPEDERLRIIKSYEAQRA